MAHTPAWPKGVEIPLRRGLFLSGLLFVLPTFISDLAFFLGVDTQVDSLKEGIQIVILYCFILSVVLFIIKKFGLIELKLLLFSRIPTIFEVFICSCVGFLLGFFRLIASLRYGYRLEEPYFIEFMIYAIILKSILWPLVEEPIFRVIFFVTLYKWKNSRLIAYSGSSFFFLLFHYVSIIPLGLNSLGSFHICFILVAGIITAYLYDRRGNILLCVLVHGIPNGSDFFGAILGYLLGVQPPGG